MEGDGTQGILVSEKKNEGMAKREFFKITQKSGMMTSILLANGTLPVVMVVHGVTTPLSLALF